jgi:hypothetical protein
MLPPPIFGFPHVLTGSQDPSSLLFEATFLIKYGSGKSGGLERNSPGLAEIA